MSVMEILVMEVLATEMPVVRVLGGRGHHYIVLVRYRRLISTHRLGHVQILISTHRGR